MKVRRDINSIPARSAADTWSIIVGLVTGRDSQNADDLHRIAGIVASIITDEHPSRRPFILSGVGPRLVIYCRFASEAVTGDENIASLQWNPTAGDWRLLIPCDQENMAWVKAALVGKSSRVIVYDVDSPNVNEASAEAPTKAAQGIEIDWTAGGT